MKVKTLSAVAGAALALGVCATAAFAYPGHPGHHGSRTPGMKAVWTVLQPDQKAQVKQIYQSARPTLKADFQNVRAARQALAQALVSGGDVTTAEQNLETAQKTLMEEKVSVAQQVAALLNSSQRAAAAQLLTELENTHKQVHGYFEQARAQAAGSGSSNTQPSPQVAE
jgi:Spy/CpxP family protein refolding chaperone